MRVPGDAGRQILAVIERGEGENKKGFRTRIGVAFQNRDPSWNLRCHFTPTRMGETTIQPRPFDAKPEGDATEPEPAPEPAPRWRTSVAFPMLGTRRMSWSVLR